MIVLQLVFLVSIKMMPKRKSTSPYARNAQRGSAARGRGAVRGRRAAGAPGRQEVQGGAQGQGPPSGRGAPRGPTAEPAAVGGGHNVQDGQLLDPVEEERGSQDLPPLSGNQFAQLLATIQDTLRPEGNAPELQEVEQPGNVGGLGVESVHTPVGLYVPQNLRQKIVNGECVELGQLLAPNISSQQYLSVVRGRVVLQSQTNSVKITTIDQWSDAFLIFMSIYLSVHSDALQGILKYFRDIRLGARRCSGKGWLVYDELFRKNVETDPTTDWGVIDPELWMLHVNNTNPAPHDTNSSASRFLKCYDFNNIGRCGRVSCDYLHKCLSCNGDHPASRCTFMNFRFGAGQQRPRGRYQHPRPYLQPRGFLPQASRGFSRGASRSPAPRFFSNSYQ